MTSLAHSPLTMVAALKAADKELGPDRIWVPAGPVQENWLRRTYVPNAALIDRIPEIDRHATRSVTEHVAWLAAHGWPAQINLALPDSVFTAGILDVKVEWLKRGKRFDAAVQTSHGRQQFPFFSLETGVILHSLGQGRILIELRTLRGDVVHICEASSSPMDDRELVAEVQTIFAQPAGPVYDYHGVELPMVDLSTKQELNWAVGLETTDEQGDPWFVARACEQDKLRMNDVGARAQAAVEMAVLRGISFSRPYRVTRPFLFSITRPSVTKEPLFVAYVDYDTWRDPGEL